MLKSVSLAVLPAFVLLSACGGGGGSPSSASSNPPPPPPADPPSNANASLLDLQKSESFTNDAVEGTVSYPAAGSATASVGKVSLKVIYDATSKTYQVEQGSRSIKFAASDRDADLSNAAVTVFKKTSGNTTDSLTLSRPAISGALTYQYVGSGFWQSTTQDGSSGSAKLDAFTYGVETPDSVLPRSGAAHYSIDLLGISASKSNIEPLSISGTGSLDVDFARGTIQVAGTANETNAETPAGSAIRWSVPFSGLASVSSSQNMFDGSFTYGYLDGTGGLFSGALDGRFYGPDAEEVGAAVSGKNAGGDVMAGAITGRQAPGVGSLTVTDFLGTQHFDAAMVTGVVVPSGGGLFTSTVNGYDTTQINEFDWNRENGTYTLAGGFSPGDKVSPAADGVFTTYSKADPSGTTTAHFYNTGSNNADLALTYTTFVEWEAPNSSFGGTGISYSTYGFETPLAQMPHSGAADYSGKVYGKAFEVAGANLYDVRGDAIFSFDFGAGTFGGSMNVIASTGTSNIDFGKYDFAQGAVRSDEGLPPRFAGSIVAAGGSTSLGSLAGGFYGPRADEIAALFQMSAKNPSNGDDYGIFGAVVGKR
jgi:hypothetical protein